MEVLREINLLSICIRVLLSLVIGGILGIERGRKNRPAGFRTYMLVCLGASLVMMTNQYIYELYQTGDPVRMGAQVISGIGFLGAGTIMITGRQQVKGITTAAGLWAAACCGLAIGTGFYEGAIVGGLVILFVMGFMDRTENLIRKKNPVLDVYIEFTGKKTFSSFLTNVREYHFDVSNIQMTKNKYSKGDELCALLTIETQERRDHSEVLALLSAIEGVEYVEEL